MNELLLSLARWVDAHDWSTQIHESIYLYSWIEGTHVLTLTLFLGMLVIIDLRMIGKTFTHIPADKLAARLNRPMFIGFVVMVISGSLLYYAIPVRTTQSIWFRIKVVLLITAGINAWLFHRAMQASVDTWSKDETPPPRIRRGAATSLMLWLGVVFAGRAMAYDWYDCHKPQSEFIYWVAGCVDELAALPQE